MAKFGSAIVVTCSMCACVCIRICAVVCRRRKQSRTSTLVRRLSFCSHGEEAMSLNVLGAISLDLRVVNTCQRFVFVRISFSWSSLFQWHIRIVGRQIAFCCLRFGCGGHELVSVGCCQLALNVHVIVSSALRRGAVGSACSFWL